MRINEVEARVGISKKSIRFYEQEGLIKPGRSLENGYRDYTPADVDELGRIKVLRKLGVPIEEIRALQQGRLTLSDAVRRHLVTLEGERTRLDRASALCEQLAHSAVPLDRLDPWPVLGSMEREEELGSGYPDKQRGDRKSRFLAPAAAAAAMVALMAALAGLILWSLTTARPAPPAILTAVLTALPLAVVVGVLLALRQRWNELRKGEEDEARKY